MATPLTNVTVRLLPGVGDDIGGGAGGAEPGQVERQRRAAAERQGAGEIDLVITGADAGGGVVRNQIPKSESRNPKEIRSSKVETEPERDCIRFRVFSLKFGFPSDFEIRISDLMRALTCRRC